jgi:hypothetical protein
MAMNADHIGAELAIITTSGAAVDFAIAIPPRTDAPRKFGVKFRRNNHSVRAPCYRESAIPPQHAIDQDLLGAKILNQTDRLAHSPGKRPAELAGWFETRTAPMVTWGGDADPAGALPG